MLPRWLSLLVVLVAVPPTVWTGGGYVTSCHHYTRTNKIEGWKVDKKECAQSVGCFFVRAKPRERKDGELMLNEAAAWYVAGNCWSDSFKVPTAESVVALHGDESSILTQQTLHPLTLSFESSGCADPAKMNKCTEETLQGTLKLKDTAKDTEKRKLPVTLCCCDQDNCNAAEPSPGGQRYPAAPNPPMERPQLKCENKPEFCGQPGDEGICVHDGGKDEFVCVTAKATGDLEKRWQWCAVTEKVDWQPGKPFTNTLCRYDIKDEGRVCCCAGPSCMNGDLADVPTVTTTTSATANSSGVTCAPTSPGVGDTGKSSAQSGGQGGTTVATKDDQSSLPLAVGIIGYALAGVLLLVVVVLIVLLLRSRQTVQALRKSAPESGVPVAAAVGATATDGPPPAAKEQVPPPNVADKAPQPAEEEPKSTKADSESESSQSNPLDAHTDSGTGPSCSASSERSRAEGAAVRLPKDGGGQKEATK